MNGAHLHKYLFKEKYVWREILEEDVTATGKGRTVSRKKGHIFISKYKTKILALTLGQLYATSR